MTLCRYFYREEYVWLHNLLSWDEVISFCDILVTMFFYAGNWKLLVSWPFFNMIRKELKSVHVMWLSIVVSSIFLYIFHSSSGVVYFSCIHRIYFNIFIAFCFFRYKTIQISRCPTYFSFSSITSIHTNLTLSYMLPYCSLISITRSITLL